MKVSKITNHKKLVIFAAIFVALIFMMEPLVGNVGNTSNGNIAGGISAPVSASPIPNVAASGSSITSSDGTYTLGQIGNPDYVNSYEASTVCDFYILDLIYNSATTELTNGTYYYCLATGFNETTAPTGMTTFDPVTGATTPVVEIYTVHIRPGVEWSDYTSANAQDTYVYSNHVSFNNASGVHYSHTYSTVYNTATGANQTQKPITMKTEYVQSADFILSWEILQSSTEYSGSYAGVVNVVPINNLTVEYYLDIPSATFVPYTLETPILPYHIWAPHDYASARSGIWNETTTGQASAGAYNDWDLGHTGAFGAGNGEYPDMVGTGPFMMNGGYGMPMGKVFTSDYWQVYANPNYFLKNVKGNDGFEGTNCTDVSRFTPHIYSIKTYIYSGPSPAVAALKDNKIDAIESSISSGFVQTAIGISGVHVIDKASTGYAYFKFNSFSADAPFNITAFRQALRYDSPLGYVQSSICDGAITSGYSILPAINAAYYDSSVPAYAYSPAKANSTIAGIHGMKYKGGEWYYNGKEVTATIQSPSESLIPQIFTGYQEIATDWTKLGIRTTVESESFTAEIGYFDAYGPTAASPSASYNVITLGISGLLGDPIGDLITFFNYSASVGTGDYEGPFSSLDITSATSTCNALFNVSAGMKNGTQIDSLMINLTQFANTNSSVSDVGLAIYYMQYIEDEESTMMPIGYGPVDHLAVNNDTFVGVTDVAGDMNTFWYYNEMSVHLRSVPVSVVVPTAHVVVSALANGSIFLNGDYGKVTFTATDNKTGAPISGAAVTVGEDASLLPMIKEANNTMEVNDTGLKGTTNSSGVFVYYFKVTALNTVINIAGYNGNVTISAIVVPTNTTIASSSGKAYISDYPEPVMYTLDSPGILVAGSGYKYFNITVYNELTGAPIPGYAYKLQAMQAAINIKNTTSTQAISVRSTYIACCNYTEMSVPVNKTYSDPNVVSISGVSNATGVISILVEANSTFNYTLNGNNYLTYIFIGDYALVAPVTGIAPFMEISEVTSQFNINGYGVGEPVDIPIMLEHTASTSPVHISVRKKTVTPLTTAYTFKVTYISNGTAVPGYNINMTSQNALGANRGYFIGSSESAVNPNAALATTCGPDTGSAYLPMVSLITNSNGMAYANFSSLYYNDTGGVISPFNIPGHASILPFDEFQINIIGDGAPVIAYLTPISNATHVYDITFNETGLISGESWTATVNGTPTTSGVSSFAIGVTNGTYSYSLSNPVSHTSNYSIVVNGSNVYAVPVTFYNATFGESGLISGDVWMIESNGYTMSSNLSTIAISSLNGTYNYTEGNAVSNMSTSITVHGANYVASTVTFYNVTFSETGLKSGTSWNVTLNGYNQSSTSSTNTFSMLNDTYHYTVGNVTDYKITKNASGSGTVNGKGVTVDVTFAKKVNYTDYYIIGGVIAAIVIIGGAIYLVKRKPKAPKQN